MRKNILLAISYLALGTTLLGQAPTFSTRQLVLPLQNNPQQVSGISASKVGGGTGSASYFYWVVPVYTIGKGPLSNSAFIGNVVNTLSGSQGVRVSWSVPSNPPASYDLLRTTTPVPPIGACACAVATAITLTTQDDTSNSLGAYTVATLNPDTLPLELANEAISTGVSHLILRQNGVFVVDLSLGGSGATPCGSTSQIQFNTAGALGCDSRLTFTTANGLLSTSDLSAAEPWVDARQIPLIPNDATKSAANATALNDYQVARGASAKIRVLFPTNLGDWYISNVHCKVDSLTFAATSLTSSQAGPVTSLIFPANSPGVQALYSEGCTTFSSFDMGYQGPDQWFNGILSSYVVTGTGDGIRANVQVFLYRNWVQGFSRHCMNLNTNGAASIYPIDSVNGNMDNSELETNRCTNNRGAGFNVEGIDSNQIYFKNNTLTNNQFWGANDNSAFGNVWEANLEQLNNYDETNADLPAGTAVDAVSITNQIATITTHVAHGLRVSSQVVMQSTLAAAVNAEFRVYSVTDATHFAVLISSAANASVGAGGVVKEYQGAKVWLDYQIGPVALSTASRSNNVACFVSAAPTAFGAQSDFVSVKGVTTGDNATGLSFNGILKNYSVTDSTHVCVYSPGANVGPFAVASGTIGFAGGAGGGYKDNLFAHNSKWSANYSETGPNLFSANALILGAAGGGGINTDPTGNSSTPAGFIAGGQFFGSLNFGGLRNEPTLWEVFPGINKSTAPNTPQPIIIDFFSSQDVTQRAWRMDQSSTVANDWLFLTDEGAGGVSRAGFQPGGAGATYLSAGTTGQLYLNWHGGTQINFCNGAGTCSANVASTGAGVFLSLSTGIAGTTGNVALSGATSGTLNLTVNAVAGTGMYTLPDAGGGSLLLVGVSGSTVNGNCAKFSNTTGLLVDSGSACFSLATTYKTISCQPGMGDGLNAISAGTYLMSECLNEFGATWTLTAIKCYTDNNGTSTLNVTNNSGTGLLTGAVTCSNAFAAGTQSGTTTLTSGQFTKFIFVADGTSKQTTWVITGTR